MEAELVLRRRTLVEEPAPDGIAELRTVRSRSGRTSTICSPSDGESAMPTAERPAGAPWPNLGQVVRHPGSCSREPACPTSQQRDARPGERGSIAAPPAPWALAARPEHLKAPCRGTAAPPQFTERSGESVPLARWGRTEQCAHRGNQAPPGCRASRGRPPGAGPGWPWNRSCSL